MEALPPPSFSRAALPWRRAVVALLAAAALILSSAPAIAVSDEQVEEDSDVQAARERKAAADEQLRELLAALDHAAAAYENAHAHHLRLLAEGADSDDAVAGAQRDLEGAESGFSQRIAEAYRRPGRQLKVAEAVLLSPDVGGALHRAAMLDHVAVRRAGQVGRAERRAQYIADLAGQQQIVTLGVAGAADEREQRALELAWAVEHGQQLLAEADATLTQTRSEVRERLEEEQRLEIQRRRAEEIAAGASPPVVVDGKVCPVGSPNGFIDSWGYPRSGGRVHKGVDMFAAHGTPLYAVADGVISRVWNNRLGGLSIDLIDDAGDRYYYAHLSAASATAGQRVRTGDVIGAVGNSGNARGTPPHLHWQYHPGNGPPVNPYPLARALCRA